MKVNKKGLLLIIGIIIFIIIAVTIGGQDKREYQQKDTITYENTEYSITKVEKDDEYINVTIKIKNKGDEPVKYDNYHFMLLNEKGKQIDKKSLVFDDGTILSNGELNKNEEVEGKIIWLNQKYKSLRIRYYDNMFLSNIDDYKFEWSLNK